jgi:hypothetical protein
MVFILLLWCIYGLFIRFEAKYVNKKCHFTNVVLYIQLKLANNFTTYRKDLPVVSLSKNDEENRIR